MRKPRDRGFTLIEILVVIAILGLLASIVVFVIRGTKADAEGEATCPAERHQLITAVEAYFAETGTTAVPDAGGAEGYEQSLVDFGLLKRPSKLYDLDTDGELVVVATSPCTV